MSKAGALGRLTEQERKFVEGHVAGMTGVEAAKYCGGSKATSRGALAVFATRWKAKPEIQAAIAELREQIQVEDEGLARLARKALRDVVQDSGNRNAQAKAAAEILRITQPDRHLHLHAHAHAEAAELDKAELQRLERMAIGGSSLELRCPHCGRSFKAGDALPDDASPT
jgi:phage terminase small subunit